MASEAQKSGVWKYFDLNAVTQKTKCTLCSVDLSYKGGGTSSMWKHMASKHPTFNIKSDRNQQQNRPLKQNTLEGHLRRPVSREKYLSITEKAALVCVRDLRPLSLFEGSGMRDFCNVLNPSYTPPTHKTIRKYILNMYENAKTVLVDKIKDEDVAVTTDMWTSVAMDSYITVTGHYISSDWKMRNKMLATRNVEERHTGINIAASLLSITKEFGIENVTAATTDNASNMDLAMRTAGIERVKCFAHTLQLAVNEGLALPAFDSLIINARKLVAFFSKSTPATNALHNHQTKLGKKPKGVISDVLTRWNSSFFLLERLHIIKSDIYSVLNEQEFVKHKSLYLKEHHWILIEQILSVLKTLVSATEVLCMEEYPSSGSVYPLLFGLMGKHLVSSDIESTAVRAFKEKVAEGLRKRLLFNQFHASPTAMASVFDPQYRKLKFLTEDQRAETLEKTKQIISDIAGNIVYTPASTETPDETSHVFKVEPTDFSVDEADSPPLKKKKQDDDVLRFLMGSIIEIDDEDEDSSLDSELQGYLQDTSKVQPGGSLDWWRSNEQRYPNVAKAARRYLAIPATSVPSERAFSTAGLTLSKHRSSLEPDMADAIIFLNKNHGRNDDVKQREPNLQMETRTLEPMPCSTIVKDEPQLPTLPEL